MQKKRKNFEFYFIYFDNVQQYDSIRCWQQFGRYIL